MPEPKPPLGLVLRPVRAGSPQAYLFALFCVAAASLVRWALGLAVEDIASFPPFFAAVVFASLVGGTGPGLLAAALGLPLSWSAATGTFLPVNAEEVADFAAYLASAALIVWGVDRHGLAQRFRAQDELQSIVIDELRHRLRNKLSTVQAIIALQLRDQPSRRDQILKALGAVDAADNFVTAARGRGARLADLVNEELAPYDPSRATVAGPEIRLPSGLATTMALVLHELATNAAKYGALSTCGGRLTIEWTATARELSFVWRETEGPEVVAPAREGFGTRLFSRALAPFNGRLDAKFHPSGLRCEIKLPL